MDVGYCLFAVVVVVVLFLLLLIILSTVFVVACDIVKFILISFPKMSHMNRVRNFLRRRVQDQRGVIMHSTYRKHVLLAAVTLGVAAAYNNGMARAPPLGWQTWCSAGKCGTDHW